VSHDPGTGQKVEGKASDHGRENVQSGGQKVEEDASITLDKYVALAQINDDDKEEITSLIEHEFSSIKERDAPSDLVFFPGHGKSRMNVRRMAIYSSIKTLASARGSSAKTEKRKACRTNPSMGAITNAAVPGGTLVFQHPALRRFMEDVANIVKVEEEEAVSEDLLKETVKIAKAQKRVQNQSEDAWVSAFVPLLKQLFAACGVPFWYAIYTAKRGAGAPDTALAVRPDDAEDIGARITVTSNQQLQDATIAALIEVKQDWGSSGNPWPELHTYYAAQAKRCVRQSPGGGSLVKLWRNSRMPCILSVLAGPYWSAGCAVVETSLMMECIGPSVELCSPEARPYHILTAARHLRAWVRTVDAVATAIVTEAAAESSVRHPKVSLAFPHVLVRKGATRERVNFVQHLERGV